MKPTWLRKRNLNHTYPASLCYMLEIIYEDIGEILTFIHFHDFTGHKTGYDMISLGTQQQLYPV